MAKVVFLGGSTGLGLALATESERRGHETVITRSGDFATTGLSAAQLPLDLSEPLDLGSCGEGRAIHSTQDMYVETIAECDMFLWVAGIWLRGPFHETPWKAMNKVLAIQFAAPAQILQEALRLRMLRPNPRPIHLVVVSSSSSWKVRGDGQVMYGAAQAAKAQFARNLCAELQVTLPGSMVTLACPGGMRTGFFTGSNVDPSWFMNPIKVSECIWTSMELPHENGLLEMHLTGNGDDVSVSYGPKLPG